MSEALTHRLIHLDLKGAPPKPIYLRNLFSLIKRWGATGVIIEWEDCFPYKNELEVLNNKIYSIDDVMQLIEDAQEANLIVIPLVQTFGHLEFVLKHKVFVQFREVPLFPSSLCPSNPGSLELVIAMVKQVVELHSGLKYIHIGADEVWHMGLCERCKNRIDQGETREDLFLKYVKRVAEIIKQKWPSLNIIMWDDMLREMDEATLQTYNLKSILEPMVWHYSAAHNFVLPPNLLRKYTYFNNIWVAGAFKGATGGSQLMPTINHHASNILQWTCLISQLKNFRGIALTGWSRYDHFAALCELLPTSLPSLGVCLVVIEEKSYTPSTVAKVEADLGYSNEATSAVRPLNRPFDFVHSSKEIYSLILKFVNLRQSIYSAINSEQIETWMNEWQVSKDLVNPMQLVALVPVLNSFLAELNEIEKFLKCHMSAIYFLPTIEEWIGTYVNPVKNRLQKVIQTSDEQIAKASSFVDEAMKSTKKYVMAIEMDC